MAEISKKSSPETIAKVVVYNSAFFLNGLLIFLLIFEEKFSVPVWMQPFGRLHPLILHFPLVVILLYAIWSVLIQKPASDRWHSGVASILLLIGVITSVFAAFSGFILSKEGGYDANALFWHKWLGVFISIGTIVWYTYPAFFAPWKIASKIMAVFMVGVLMVGGHLGGNLTHGEDFLSVQFTSDDSDRPKVSIEEAKVYNDLVKPVLEQKCYSCHNDQKDKGGLQMQTEALLKKGGKNGVLWDTTKADLGLLLSRVHLPEDDKKHMPPRGKPQLTDEEVVLLAAWIKAGSDFDLKVTSLPQTSPVYQYAQNVLGGGRTEDVYDFAAANTDDINTLNTTYRRIKPIAMESPALAVNFYNRATFKSSDISDLSGLKEQIVSMDLSKMPVKDEDLKTIAQFPQLRTLILNFTDITGASLSELKKLPNIREISLSGTKVTFAQVQSLKDIPSVKKVFVWSTGISIEDLGKLKSEKQINFETGFRSDTIVMALNAPVIENEEPILKPGVMVKLKHQIPGTEIRYTLDGTDPDSTTSVIYTKPIAIEKNTLVKAKAFKKGWYGSKITEKFFIKAGFPIDSARLVNLPDPKYRAKLDLSIRDDVKSDESGSSGKWLGYRDADFQAFLLFKKPVKASSVTLSMFRNVGGFIFPPHKIEVWGGKDEKNLRLLKVMNPDMPDKTTSNVKNIIFTADFPTEELSCFKVVAKPLGKLPAWHPGKGQKAWVFVDEVLVN